MFTYILFQKQILPDDLISTHCSFIKHPWDINYDYHPILQMKERKESEVAQSCPTLCDPMDCILPGSSIHGIFQARMLEWVVISFSTGNIVKLSVTGCNRYSRWQRESWNPGHQPPPELLHFCPIPTCSYLVARWICSWHWSPVSAFSLHQTLG